MDYGWLSQYATEVEGPSANPAAEGESILERRLGALTAYFFAIETGKAAAYNAGRV